MGHAYNIPIRMILWSYLPSKFSNTGLKQQFFNRTQTIHHQFSENEPRLDFNAQN